MTNSVLGGTYTILNENDDLNDCTKTGTYLVSGGYIGSSVTHKLLNCPVENGTFAMLVIRGSSSDATYFIQIVLAITARSDSGIYYRYLSSNGIGKWNKVESKVLDKE